MSHIALVDWQRKPATQIRPGVPRRASVQGFLKTAHRFAWRHRALTVSFAAAALAGSAWVFVEPAAPPLGMPATGSIDPARAAPLWTDIIRPIALFGLEASDLAKAPQSYEARRSLGGGGRRDTLNFGTFGSGEPMLRLTVYRRGSEAYAPGPVFADLARSAAEAGLSVARSGLPDLMATRFGAFEVLDLALKTETVPAARCSGFRLVLDAPTVTMTGLACGGTAAALTRERLSCLLERLDLTSGGDDRSLVAFFAATELKRNARCKGMRLTPDMAHTAWHDDRSATPRKNARHRRGN